MSWVTHIRLRGGSHLICVLVGARRRLVKVRRWFEWFGLFNGFADDCVVAVRELVMALIAVEGGSNGPNGDALSDTS